MSDQPLDRDRITKLVSTIFADDLHAKRVASLAGAAVGVLEGAALGIHAIGKALAMSAGLKTKHAVKQVDRLLSNEGIAVWSLFASWVPFVVGDRPEIVTALDWTDFDQDDQSTLVLSMITSHGRATPLLWKTVVKSDLAGWRNEHEDILLERFREVLPEGVKVTSSRRTPRASATTSRALSSSSRADRAGRCRRRGSAYPWSSAASSTSRAAGCSGSEDAVSR